MIIIKLVPTRPIKHCLLQAREFIKQKSRLQFSNMVRASFKLQSSTFRMILEELYPLIVNDPMDTFNWKLHDIIPPNVYIDCTIRNIVRNTKRCWLQNLTIREIAQFICFPNLVMIWKEFWYEFIKKTCKVASFREIWKLLAGNI